MFLDNESFQTEECGLLPTGFEKGRKQDDDDKTSILSSLVFGEHRFSMLIA